MVGITNVDVMLIYGTLLNACVSGGVTATANSKVTGDYTATSVSGNIFLKNPARQITITNALSTNCIYFVPALDFKGVKANSSDISTPDGFVADGKTLYKVTGTTMTKIGF